MRVNDPVFFSGSWHGMCSKNIINGTQKLGMVPKILIGNYPSPRAISEIFRVRGRTAEDEENFRNAPEDEGNFY